MRGLKIVQRLKEKNRWMLVCVAILTVAAFTISLILVCAPQEDPPPRETETADSSALTAPPRLTAAPTPEPTPTPAITPPAQSAASGSDVILQHIPRTSESDLNDGPASAPQAGSETDT